MIFSIRLILLTLLGAFIIFMVTGCSVEEDDGPTGSINTPPAEPSNPNPVNSATDVATDVRLTWTCSDSDGDTLVYEMYLGTHPDTLELKSDYILDTGYTPSPGLLVNTTYYWLVIANDGNGGSAESPVWTFTTMSVANAAPEVPSNPDPSNNEVGVSRSTTLQWECSDPDGDELEYDLYFGTNTETDFVKVLDRWSGPSNAYSPGTLELTTTYYWKVVAYDEHSHMTEGPIWQFTTEGTGNNPPNPPTIWTNDPGVPDDGDIFVPITGTALGWRCDDNDGDELTYNVYFGDSNPPALVSNMQDSTNYRELGTLDYMTTYYWQIVAYDPHGDSTAGDLWSFTTLSETNYEAIIFYGNVTGDPINTNVGERFDVDVYIYTSETTFGGTILLAPGTNSQYIDSLLSLNEAEIYYPFNEWDAVYFYNIVEYEPGWFVESFQGFFELAPPFVSPALHFEIPTLALKMKMKAVNESSYAGQSFDAFEPGVDPIQGPSNLSDTTGTVNYNINEQFRQLHFNQ